VQLWLQQPSTPVQNLQQQLLQQPAIIQACQQQVAAATTAADLLQGLAHVHLAASGCT
jgi:hypothetical protein